MKEEGGLLWLDEEAREDFRKAGLDSLAGLCSFQGGEVVSRAATRVCRKVPLGEKVYYVKTQVVQPSRLPLKKWPSYLGKGSPLAREARNALRLRGMGVPTPKVAAWGLERFPWGMPKRSALVTRAMEGFTDLEALALVDPEKVRVYLAALEDLVAHLHRRGWVLGGVKLRNVLAGPSGELALLDLPDLGRVPFPGKRERDLKVLRADAERVLGREPVRARPESRPQ